MKIAVANPNVANAYGVMSMETIWNSPEELRKWLRADIQRWRGIVEQIGFAADSSVPKQEGRA